MEWIDLALVGERQFAQTCAVEVAELKPICQKVSEVRLGSVGRVCLVMARAEEQSKLISETCR